MPPNAYFECGTCDKAFPAGLRARDKHCRSTGHSPPNLECDTCHRWFWSERARQQHMDALDHRVFSCSVCSETWPSQDACTEHEHDDHLYCADCDRYFQSDNNLRMHLNSRVHRGLTVLCPFCSRLFSTATGLTHHLETASCPKAPQLNRDELFRIVRSKDPGGIISKNLLEWTSSYEYEVDSGSWNGRGYECFICGRVFGRLSSLEQHLNSPIHQQELYHCPNTSCCMNFKTLAGIINHLESESCRFIKFERVQRSVNNFVSSNRLLSF
ncbi:zinc-finger double-stranded RNA-binding domain-containing protein [Hirsutella rhossiliensis]|uniref:Zinc-finger double-stranded RNA-binding domain-containing protein n=1 Tax=Hirsutella rhossiliensis TaxID=111463 RepID=A0A9P8N0L8_9HYPO|nr:zinc-finger double-stranded RNA-binding domain-containing protein [Hirsutella rhossiliensis]KAH0962562.1 zinc-finger double-stranded RNA-binding domain-containing protein [Hirsutella rhossiliensis]